MYEVVNYIKSNGRCPILDFISELKNTSGNFQQLEKMLLFTKKLEEFGMKINEYYTRDAVKKLKDNIYELRPLKVRILFTIFNQKFVLLHAFYKKTKKTPPNEIKNAIEERNDYIARLGDML